MLHYLSHLVCLCSRQNISIPAVVCNWKHFYAYCRLSISPRTETCNALSSYRFLRTFFVDSKNGQIGCIVSEISVTFFFFLHLQNYSIKAISRLYLRCCPEYTDYLQPCAESQPCWCSVWRRSCTCYITQLLGTNSATNRVHHYILLVPVRNRYQKWSSCDLWYWVSGWWKIHSSSFWGLYALEKSWCDFVSWRKNIGSWTDGFPLLLCGASVRSVCFPHQWRFATPALPPCFRTTEAQQQHTEASRPCCTSCFLLRYKDLPDTTWHQNTPSCFHSLATYSSSHTLSKFDKTRKETQTVKIWEY